MFSGQGPANRSSLSGRKPAGCREVLAQRGQRGWRLGLKAQALGQSLPLVLTLRQLVCLWEPGLGF